MKSTTHNKRRAQHKRAGGKCVSINHGLPYPITILQYPTIDTITAVLSGYRIHSMPHLLLGSQRDVLERVGSLVLALSTVQRAQVLERCRHRRAAMCVRIKSITLPYFP